MNSLNLIIFLSIIKVMLFLSDIIKNIIYNLKNKHIIEKFEGLVFFMKLYKLIIDIIN